MEGRKISSPPGFDPGPSRLRTLTVTKSGEDILNAARYIISKLSKKCKKKNSMFKLKGYKSVEFSIPFSVIIIVTFVITFMYGNYNYIPETNHV